MHNTSAISLRMMWAYMASWVSPVAFVINPWCRQPGNPAHLPQQSGLVVTLELRWGTNLRPGLDGGRHLQGAGGPSAPLLFKGLGSLMPLLNYGGACP